MKCLVLLLVLPLFAQQISKERALGEKLATDIMRQSKPVEEPIVVSYVQRTGSRLVANLDRSSGSYSFDVIVTDESLEPIPLPGGWILVPASFIADARDEGEFAGMMAHAIAHIAARRGRGSPAGESSAGPVRAPVIFNGGRYGLHAPSSIAPAQFPLGFLQAQRHSESEADRFGIELAHRAGYDPAGLRRYISRTQPDDRKLSPVSSRDLRLAKMDDVLRSLSATVSTTGRFERVRERTRELLGEFEIPRTPSLLRQ